MRVKGHAIYFIKSVGLPAVFLEGLPAVFLESPTPLFSTYLQMDVLREFPFH